MHTCIFLQQTAPLSETVKPGEQTKSLILTLLTSCTYIVLKEVQSKVKDLLCKGVNHL